MKRTVLSLSFCLCVAGAFALFFVVRYVVAGSSQPDESQISIRDASAQTSKSKQTKTELPLFDPVADQAENNLVLQSLREKSADGSSEQVIIGLNIKFTPEGYLNPVERLAQRERIRRAQEAFLASLPNGRANLIALFDAVPFLTVRADALIGYQSLAGSSQVSSVQQNEELIALLDESIPLVRAPGAWNRGFSGAGQTIAIIDTGIDKYHPFLNNKVVSEACYGTNSGTYTSLCPGGATATTAPNSGLNCPTWIDGCFHGTYVAGIAAGSDPSINRFGVARDAQLIALQVFSRRNSDNALITNFSDMNRGLQRVVDLINQNPGLNVAAVNLSIGDNTFVSANYCDSRNSLTTSLFNTLRSYNVAPVAASGNNHSASGLTFPACISSAVTVGSTRDGSAGYPYNEVDSVSGFSNSAYYLNLLAPGEDITSSVPGGGYATYYGTSAAAPHVAGAWAILKSRSPGASVNQVLNSLSATGRPVTDPRNGITKPRIVVDRALVNLAPEPPRPFFDFDPDGKTDLAVFRPSDGHWRVHSSQTGTELPAVSFGTSTDVIVPADYDGDGRTDVAVWRPSEGVWYLQRSRAGFAALQWGISEDIPAPADFDGDGLADLAVFRPSTNVWYIRQSSDHIIRYEYFGAGGDKPVPADYDGDGKAEVAVFRPSNGVWYYIGTQSGVFNAVQFGLAGDKTVQADYDGDGRTDVAVFRNVSNNGVWYVNRSTEGFLSTQFGFFDDLPTPGDYDGDGRADIAIWRPSTAVWWLNRSSAGVAAIGFGVNGDRPIPNAYVR